MGKWTIMTLFLIANIFFFACKTTQEQTGTERAELVRFEFTEVEFDDYKRTVIDEKEVGFGNYFYQYGNFNNSFFIYDVRSKKILRFNYKGKFLEEIDEKTILNFESEPSSIYIDHDTTYLLYFHKLKVAKTFGDSVQIINLSERYARNFTSPMNRLEVLENGNILIPYALNIYNNYSESKDLVRKRSDLKNPESLFALYSANGELLKRFGEFPASNNVRNPNLVRNAYLYYAVKDDKIYVTFPLGGEIYIYNTAGEVLSRFSFDLPEFEENVKAGEYGNDCLLGIAVDKNSEGEILYLHAVSHVSPRKIKHLLYEMNLREKTVVYGEILNGNNYLLPYAKDGRLLFLKSFIRKEEKEIVSYDMK